MKNSMKARLETAFKNAGLSVTEEISNQVEEQLLAPLLAGITDGEIVDAAFAAMKKRALTPKKAVVKRAKKTTSASPEGLPGDGSLS